MSSSCEAVSSDFKPFRTEKSAFVEPEGEQPEVVVVGQRKAEVVVSGHNDQFGPWPVISAIPPKPASWDMFRKNLQSAKYICAPMVDGSELPWRMLVRKYGAQACWSPMFNAHLYSTVPEYRAEQFTTCEGDRPLVVQFCAHNAQTLFQAAMMVADKCDAVDLNLGCPQHIAKRGHYGSWLQEEWDLIYSLVGTLHRCLPIPVTVKIRIFDDEEKTLRYAKMIQAAGAQLLTVHGRTREQRGHNAGRANWNMIRKIRESLDIPVVANGNIRHLQDVHDCLEATGCVGVMSAETLLWNPALFSGKHVDRIDAAIEYIEFVEKYPVHLRMVKAHLFFMLEDYLPIYPDLRARLANEWVDLDNFKSIMMLMKDRRDADRIAGTIAEKTWREHKPSKREKVIMPDFLEANLDGESIQLLG